MSLVQRKETVERSFEAVQCNRCSAEERHRYAPDEHGRETFVLEAWAVATAAYGGRDRPLFHLCPNCLVWLQGHFP
jgi:hypothetical protein